MPIFDTGRTFEIYSIGDGLFMRRVIDSVAAMSNAGLLLDLLALSMMLGLLIMAFRNVVHGGNKLDLGSMLVALILGTTMFGMKGRVVIHDMNFAPGEVDQPTYVVDNVPFGIAAAGYIISNVGYELTLNMEQGYGLYSGGRSTLIEGGFGNTLEWINQLRAWENPLFGDAPGGAGAGAAGRFRENMTSYMAECVRPGIEMGHLNLNQILHTTNIWSPGGPTSGGIGYDSEWLTTNYRTPAGALTTVPCSAAFGNLMADKDVVFPAFAESLAKTKLDTSTKGTDVETAMTEAYNAIGINSSQMQQLVVAEAAGTTLEAAIGGINSGVLAAQSKMMIEQASMQRAVQWAAEETMFRRIMRPMMAFFESLMYALAPFMALALGLGSYGVQTVGKYLMLSIWVALWMPMLSIIELYQVTMMQHAVDAMMTGLDASGSGGVTIAAANALRTQAIEWLSTGAAMAAFTPAITMALVWGGAITASALANQLRGADTINEKQVVPDTASVAPAVSAGTGMDHTRAGGSVWGGAQAAIPSINMSTANQSGWQSVNAQMQQAQEQYASAVSRVYQQSQGTGTTVNASTDVAHQGFTDASNFGRFSAGAGATADQTKRADGTVGASQSQVAAHQTDAKAAAGIPGGSPISAGVSTTGSNRDSQELQNAIRVAQGDGRGLRTEAGFQQGWQGSAGQRLQEAVARHASTDASFKQALSDSAEVRAAEQAISQASKSYQEQAAFSKSYGMQQNVPLNILANQANNEGRAGDLATAVSAGGLGGKAEQMYGRLSQIGDESVRRTAANIAALYEGATEGTSGGASQQLANFRATAFADAMSGQAGSISMNGGGIKPESNKGVAGDVPSYDSIKAKGESAPGPRGNPADVERTVAGAMRGDPSTLAGMEAKSQDAVGANPAGYGSLPATAGQNAGAIAQGMSTPAMGVVLDHANQNIADRTTGMSQLAQNGASSDSSADPGERIQLAWLDRNAGPLGNMGANAGNGEMVNARANAILQESPFLNKDANGRNIAQAIAMGEVLENMGPGYVTKAQYDQTSSWMKNTQGAEDMVRVYGDKQTGGAARAEGQALHDAGRETFKDRAERGE